MKLILLILLSFCIYASCLKCKYYLIKINLGNLDRKIMKIILQILQLVMLLKGIVHVLVILQ